MLVVRVGSKNRAISRSIYSELAIDKQRELRHGFFLNVHKFLELDDRVTARDEPVVTVRQDDGLVTLRTHDEIGSGGSTCRGLVNKIIGRRRAGASNDHGRRTAIRTLLER